MLREVLMSSDPEDVRPLAQAALHALEQDLPPLHESVGQVLQEAARSSSVWLLRYMLFLGLTLSEGFPLHVQRAGEPEANVQALRAHIRHEHWHHLRGVRDLQTPGHHTRYGSLQEFSEAVTRWYLKR